MKVAEAAELALTEPTLLKVVVVENQFILPSNRYQVFQQIVYTSFILFSPQ